jgi:cytochrome d ubiquinol oxidase subunit I
VEHVPAVRLLDLPDRRVLPQDPTPSFSITIPRLLSWMGTGSFDGKIEGLNQLQAQEQQQYGPGNYMPRVRLMYWSMRVMAMLGVFMFLVAAVGAWLYRKRRLEKTRWFLWTAIITIAAPYIAATFGWMLTEIGRQPWIVQGLLKTSQAASQNLTTATIAASLSVFVLLYVTLGVVDFVLMRRYARVDPPAAAPEPPMTGSAPAPGYGAA